MSSIPKLNYANLRGKSKSKDTEQADGKLDNDQGSLFSHMNQDNLKYIQNQIKLKNKKSQHPAKDTIEEDNQEAINPEPPGNDPMAKQQLDKNRIASEQPQSPHIQSSYHELIPKEPQSMHVKYHVISDNNETHRRSHHEQAFKKFSEEGEHNKVSYYDMMSQARSKRVSSLEGYLEEDNKNADNSKNGFLNHLSDYIDDLHAVKNRKKSIKIKSRHPSERVQSISQTSESEKQILKNAIYQQKKKNQVLAKQLQHSRRSVNNYKQRLETLEQIVYSLSEEMNRVKEDLTAQKIINSKLLRDHQAKEANSLEETGDQNYYSNYRYNGATIPLFSAHKRKASKVPTISQANRAGNDIFDLEKQLALFKETGELKVRQNRRNSDYE